MKSKTCFMDLQTVLSIATLIAAIWIGKVGNDIAAAQKDLAVAQNQMAQVQTYGLEPIATMIATEDNPNGKSTKLSFTIQNNRTYSIRAFKLNILAGYAKEKEMEGCDAVHDTSLNGVNYFYSCPLTENVLPNEAFTKGFDLSGFLEVLTADFEYYDPVEKRKIKAVADLSDDMDF